MAGASLGVVGSPASQTHVSRVSCCWRFMSLVTEAKAAAGCAELCGAAAAEPLLMLL